MVVRYQEPYRKDQKAIANIRLLSPSGERVSLAQLTKMEVRDGAYDIYREGNSRYLSVTFNVRGRDLGSSVEEAMAQINQKVKFPPGYRFEWSGEYESANAPQARLAGHRAADDPDHLHHSLHHVSLGQVGAADSGAWSPWRRIGGLLALLSHRHALQRVLRHRFPGALRRVGANRRHHAGVHQSASGAEATRLWMPRSKARSCGFAPS